MIIKLSQAIVIADISECLYCTTKILCHFCQLSKTQAHSSSLVVPAALHFVVFFQFPTLLYKPWLNWSGCENVHLSSLLSQLFLYDCRPVYLLPQLENVIFYGDV